MLKNELVEVETLLLFIIVEEDTEPPMLEVSVFVFEVSELGTVMEATFKLEIIASSMLVVEALTVSELVVELLVVEA
jgi:hypothetical protein